MVSRAVEEPLAIVINEFHVEWQLTEPRRWPVRTVEMDFLCLSTRIMREAKEFEGRSTAHDKIPRKKRLQRDDNRLPAQRPSHSLVDSSCGLLQPTG